MSTRLDLSKLSLMDALDLAKLIEMEAQQRYQMFASQLGRTGGYDAGAFFATMAEILAIQGENYHRIMAYRRAAENVTNLGRSLEEVWRAGELEAIPGVGKTLASKIDELMRTGHLAAYEKLQAQVPAGSRHDLPESRRAGR